MGQYHKVVNLTKGEFIDAFGLGLGQKALEQLLSHVSSQEALFLLVMATNGRGGGDVQVSDPYELIGRWAGDRIAVVGDYTEDGDLGNYSDLYKDSEVYGRCRAYAPGALAQLAGAAENDLPRPTNGDFLDITPYLRPLMEHIFGLKYKAVKEGSYTFYDREFDDEEDD